MERPFSKILKDYQVKHSFTNREMADVLGISERMYAYYEKGEYDGNPSKVKKYLSKLAGNLQGAGDAEKKQDYSFKYIHALEETVELQKEHIKLLKEKLDEK